jgi:Flp pilus assembly protein TadD
MSRSRLTGLLLALVTLAIYLPVVRHGFIIYDDGDYVTQNRMVLGGLTWAGVKWAFTTFHSANWHPLTWFSHMADVQMFGVNAAGSHLVNVLFHAANTVLLFVLLLRAAGGNEGPNVRDAFWPAALIAALFALHPLHVESVAWVAERKDVLSAFFGLLSLIYYVRYAASQKVRVDYWLAVVFFACGLMSKPMLVTWPLVMLLLDYWPLQRLNAMALRGLLVEKIPFFLLTVVSCVITYWAQNTGAVKSLAAVPLLYRLENAPVAVATYLLKLIWPAGLAVIYPMPDSIPAGAFALSLVVLICITVAGWLARKQSPFLLMGWFWFLGTLVPVLGLVKVGDAAMADRYTYIPSIGIFIAVAFGAQRFAKGLPKFILPTVAGCILAALAIVTGRQLQYWVDDETLFKHAMEVTANNVDAMINYGVALENEGKPVDAMAQYRQAEKLAPSSDMAHADIGNLLYYSGDTNGALAEYQKAVTLNPRSATLHDRLGNILAGSGRFSEGTNEFYRAMQLAPGDALPHLHLGMALAAQNNISGATNEFSAALALDSSNPAPLVEWAKVLLEQGRDSEARGMLNSALDIDPYNFQTLVFLARVLSADEHAEVRNGPVALVYALRADEVTGGGQPLVADALGMAYAENGQFDQAQSAATNAIALATAAGMKLEIIREMQGRLELYQKHEAWREKFSQ